MIKRTIEISQHPAHLTVKLEQLLIQPHDDSPPGPGPGPGARAGSIPCEDIGVVLVDHPQVTYSHAALAELARFDAVLIVCGRDHLPAGILLPLSDHSQVVWRLHDQLSIGKPLRKQLWTQLVKAKVLAQAANLREDQGQRGRLLALARKVRSGDPANIEAQAAKVYWSAWLGPPLPEGEGRGEGFRRDPDGASPNNMLNYGYAVLRAAIARALVAAGLLPALGLKHHNRSNAFCLADDLLEPLRPIVDRRVRELVGVYGRVELNPSIKVGLLEVLTLPARYGDEKGPLAVAIQRMIGSLVRCYGGESKELAIPVQPVVD